MTRHSREIRPKIDTPNEIRENREIRIEIKKDR